MCIEIWGEIVIFGNKDTLDMLVKRIKEGREPHSIIIQGEKGVGKKTMAKYIAAQLMCKRHDGVPCGECKACRMIKHDSHPDLVIAKANANGNYIVDESIRPIISDAAILPNEGNIKVYIIPDLDRSVSTAVQVQNIMLKLIEEPPDHVVIIMTARSKEVFLSTIISRTLSIGMIRVSDNESRLYLKEKFPDSDHGEIEEAVANGRGNIGRCEEYLQKGNFYDGVNIAKALNMAVCRGSEYETLKALYKADSKKAILRNGIFLFSEIICDACSIAEGITDVNMLQSCDIKGASELADKETAENLIKLYDIAWEYVNRIDANCNVNLTMNSLAGQLCGF